MPEPVDIDPTDREEMGEEDDEWGADLMNDMNDLNDIYICLKICIRNCRVHH